MELPITCECGQQITVHEGMAGLSVPCSCGRLVAVPEYRELRRLRLYHDVGPDEFIAPNLEDYREAPTAALYWIVLAWLCLTNAAVIVASFIYSGPIAGIGASLLFISHAWLFTLVYSGNPLAGAVIVIVPVIGQWMAWRFIFDHLEVARWPFLCNVIGLAVFIAGVSFAARAR